MKWTPNDMDMYLQAKEYVDTALIPLVPVSFAENMKQSASMKDFTDILTVEIERQFKGRIMLLPQLAYLSALDEEKRLELAAGWARELKEQGFAHVFYITSDSEWKENEQELEGSLIWIPSIPLEHLEEKHKKPMIDDQVRQVLAIFTRKWHE
ncbi:DUF2487 domain-containing protein [Bacillus sp. M6-12]|uniref:YpiF family protein n=1 Tax=Bacillus sp. M6-12 TaxID=2054166 RepID=UPI000C77AF41|nr:YpiF family protein [Bacillus sp. M6-12]PLS16339.1 DUF2487 domain-containing protein [Bacillus sp. M6-12]